MAIDSQHQLQYHVIPPTMSIRVTTFRRRFALIGSYVRYSLRDAVSTSKYTKRHADEIPTSGFGVSERSEGT